MCMIEDGEGCTTCSWWGRLLRVAMSISKVMDKSLFWANIASWEVSSRRFFFEGMYAQSRRMAWSLTAIFSISSMDSSRVFSLIFPLAEASRSCLEWGHKPSMKMLSWTGSLNPCVRVFWCNQWTRSRASLNDSSGCWWKDEISTFPLAAMDSGKYFFRNFSTTSSHVRKLFPLNEWSHLFASPTKEKENRLRRMTSFGILAIFTVLQILMYVARCAYGSSLGRLWNRFPGSDGWGNVDMRCWPLARPI